MHKNVAHTYACCTSKDCTGKYLAIYPTVTEEFSAQSLVTAASMVHDHRCLIEAFYHFCFFFLYFPCMCGPLLVAGNNRSREQQSKMSVNHVIRQQSDRRRCVIWNKDVPYGKLRSRLEFLGKCLRFEGVFCLERIFIFTNSMPFTPLSW